MSHNQIMWTLCPSQVVMKLIPTVLTFMYFNKWSHLSQKHSFLWTSMANKDYDNQTWQDMPKKWAGKENKWSKNHIHVTEHKSGSIYILNKQVDFRGLSRKCTSSKKMCWMNIVESHTSNCAIAFGTSLSYFCTLTTELETFIAISKLLTESQRSISRK